MDKVGRGGEHLTFVNFSIHFRVAGIDIEMISVLVQCSVKTFQRITVLCFELVHVWLHAFINSGVATVGVRL